MRAVDTNVVVRLIARDDAKQTASADRFIEGGAWVSTLALAETIWVLESVYQLSPMELATAIGMLLNHRDLAIQDADMVTEALNLFREKPALGFSDCLMLELARKSGHLPLGTFDRNLAKIEGAAAVRATIVENFLQVQPFVGRFVDPDTFQRVFDWQKRFLASHADLLARRVDRDGTLGHPEPAIVARHQLAIAPREPVLAQRQAGPDDRPQHPVEQQELARHQRLADAVPPPRQEPVEVVPGNELRVEDLRRHSGILARPRGRRRG